MLCVNVFETDREETPHIILDFVGVWDQNSALDGIIVEHHVSDLG